MSRPRSCTTAQLSRIHSAQDVVACPHAEAIPGRFGHVRTSVLSNPKIAPQSHTLDAELLENVRAARDYGTACGLVAWHVVHNAIAGLGLGFGAGIEAVRVAHVHGEDGQLIQKRSRGDEWRIGGESQDWVEALNKAIPCPQNR